MTELKSEIFKIKRGDYIKESEMESLQTRAIGNTNQKKWKANNIDKSTMEVNSFLIFIDFVNNYFPKKASF